MSAEYQTLKKKIFEAARNCATQGPGYAQQRPVLDEVASEFGGGMYTMLDLDKQQAVLTCWYDLFHEDTFSWVWQMDVFVSWRDITYESVRSAGGGGIGKVSVAPATNGPNKGLLFAVKVFDPRSLEKQG